MAEDESQRIKWSNAWRDAKGLIIAHRSRLAIGALLLLINRLLGLILPASSKYIIDGVVAKGRIEWLMPIAVAAGLATLLQAFTSFWLSQILIVAAYRAITDIRRKVQAHVTRLPISRFDSTQTGKLVARILSDAEGVRNLVGTGLIDLVGGIITALLFTAVLFYLNWRLTVITISVLLVFSAGIAYALIRLRPLFAEG